MIFGISYKTSEVKATLVNDKYFCLSPFFIWKTVSPVIVRVYGDGNANFKMMMGKEFSLLFVSLQMSIIRYISWVVLGW